MIMLKVRTQARWLVAIGIFPGHLPIGTTSAISSGHDPLGSQTRFETTGNSTKAAGTLVGECGRYGGVGGLPAEGAVGKADRLVQTSDGKLPS